jgi:hypothetical protein
MDELEEEQKKTTSQSYWERKTASFDKEWKTSEIVRSANKDDDEDDIAPIKSTKEEKGLFDFFQKGAFDDGYQFGDVTKSILGTVADAGMNAVKGIAGIGEGVGDLISYGVAGVADKMGEDAFARGVRQKAQENLFDNLLKPAEDYLDKYSVLGRTSDSLMQGVGQVGAIMATGGLGSAAGLGKVGVTALTTGLMGVSGAGSGMSEAYRDGANDLQAFKHGLDSGAADALSELIFGGLGKSLNALGFNKGLLPVDDMLAKLASSKLKNQVSKNIVEFGIKAGAEGLEEVIAGVAQAYSKYHNYLGDQGMDFADVLKDENLLEQFVVGALTSGVVQAPGLNIANKTKTDFITGRTQNEQAVVDREVENRIAEAEEDGTKLSAKEKASIQEQVEKDLEKGYISTDLIEEVVGGDTFKTYKSYLDEETKLQQEFDTLNKMKQGDMTGEQMDRRTELKERLAANKEKPKSQQLRMLLDQEVSEGIKGSRLTESYNEQTRRGQAFEADLTRYDEKQKAVIQKAIDSGILNNTNRTHEFVDMVAKISADKGVLFDFTNNEKLKTSAFAVDGKAVNGFVTKDGITINMQSAKALNTIVGHEIAHVLEGTDLYTELQNAVVEYAKTKGDYQGRFDSLSKLYEAVEGADIHAELTADLVGDYLFTDPDFIHNLSTKHRNVFQKIYDEVKYLLKVATAGSKEARQLEKVKRAFEKAYREGENARESEEISDSKTKYSIREEAPPKNTGVAYKVFFVKDGKLYPPMVANPGGADTPMGVWLNADMGTAAPPSKTGRAQVKAGGKGTQGGGGSLAFRPGWHLGDLPRASQFDRVNPETGIKELFPENFVWAEVEYAKDVDYQEEAMSYGYTDNGKFRHAYAGLPRLPENGYYRYRTNPKPDTVPWVITGAMKVNRLLSDAEVNAILEKNGVPPVHRQGGDVGLDKFGFKEDGTVKYSLSDSDGRQLSPEQQEFFKDSVVRDENGNLKVMYHGSQNGGFHVFDPSHSDDNISLFFVDSNDVAMSYSGTSETYAAKTIRTAEDMNNFLAEIGYDQYEAVEKDGKFELLEDGDHVATSETAQGIYEEFCWYEGIGDGNVNYKVYLNLTDPLVVNARGQHWNDIRSWRENAYAATDNTYVKEEDGYYRLFDKRNSKQLYELKKSSAIDSWSAENVHEFLTTYANAGFDIRTESIRTTRDVAKYAKENGYDGVIFKNLVDIGGYGGDFVPATVAIAFDGSQVKSVANQNPTTNKDIRYSLSEDSNMANNAKSLNASRRTVDSSVLGNAITLREEVAARLKGMKENGIAIPDDIKGNTAISNSSYDITEENTTICPRSLAAEAFVDAVSEYLGRPLTVQEQIYISQDLQGRSLTPECTYCYVATDRKAYRAFLGEYISQRDAVLQKLRENPNADVSRSGALYNEFRNGRKDTDPMYNRFKMWVDAYKNGKPLIEANHLANINRLMGDINSEFGAELKPQIVDAMKYAQSASWAKKRVSYVAYDGHILKWKQSRIDKLNSHYGLRMYSFSDFHPAFVLENMQMITDASVRGLKMLGYSKDTDFVEIFAPSGMNINVSTFGFESGGNVYENNIIGANWEKAKELRSQYPNVGITFVATNDHLVNWAMAQDWIDVVIPYHLVRTGEAVAKAFNYTNYTSESSDRKIAEWGKGTDKNYIAPTDHNNDKDTYLAALEKNHLKPRFERFLDNPNYMKLVNECRQPASAVQPVQPVFNREAAMVALAKLEANGYYQPVGGSVDRMYEIAAEVAENMTQQIGPQYSLSEKGKPYGRYNVYSKDVLLETAPVQEEVAPTVSEMESVPEVAISETETTTEAPAVPVAEESDLFPDDLAPTQQELEYLQAEAADIQGAMEAMAAVGDVESVNRLIPELEDVQKKIAALQEEDAQRVATLDDADAPPEMEAPYQAESDPVNVENPFDDRDWYEVSKRNVKAYMYENPEVKPFFQDEALALMSELNDTTRGERFYSEEAFAREGNESAWTGVSRHTSKSIETLLDSWHMSYADIEKGLNAIIEDHGEENIAAAKKIEFMLNDRLLNGYTDFYTNKPIPPNQDYVNLLAEMEITAYSQEAFERLLATADQYAPPAQAEDIAPVKPGYVSASGEQMKLPLYPDPNNVSPAMGEVQTEGDIAPVFEAGARKGVPEGQQAFLEDAGVPQTITRKQLHENIVDNIKATFAENGVDFEKVLKNAKNLSTFATVDNTPQRVMEKALGYKAGGILSDITVNQVAQNETRAIQWLNSFTDRKSGLLAKLSKQYGIKPGSKESAAAQMYAEGFYVGKNDVIIKYGDAELAADFPDRVKQAQIKGLAKDKSIRRIYDDTLKAINESRTRNAYPEIPRLDNYFLHFRAMNDTFSRLGLPFNPNDIRAKDLPTDLNGVTADLKPGQPFFASAMHREGKRTDFDLLGGLEQYLTSAKNQIYHIDDIQTLRALRNYIADTYGQANGLSDLDSLSEEEAQERIKEVYGSHLSTFAKFLNEEANVLAGKTALIDRGVEGIIGRRGITFLDTVNKQVGKNMVGFNVSSSMTNFISVVQAFAKSNKFDFVKALSQTAASKLKALGGVTDSFVENNPTIIRRKGAEKFFKTPYEKVSDAGYFLMSAVDNLSTEVIVRAKYNELTRKGMDQQKAAFEADKWVSRLMGDRSLGQQPQLYNSKMLGLLTKFQLEVRNQLDSQFYDTIQEAKVSSEHIENRLLRNAKTAAKVGSTFFQLAVLQHVFGKAFESVAGYNPAFDIIEALVAAFGWDDDEEDEDTVLDNIEEGFMVLLEDLPYSSTFTGGRIPISSALPVKQFITGKDQYGNEKSRWETLAEAAPYFIAPGGYGQLKKTVAGLKMFSDEHPIAGSYTDSGNLRFPVEDTLGNRVQAAVFGQWASGNARDYFDNERKALTPKQTQELSDVGISIQDYWKYREGLSGLNTLEQKLFYIDSLNLTTAQKNVLANNLTDRKEPIDMSDYDQFDSLAEFDYANDNPEKYSFFEKIGITYEQYQNADDDAKEAYDWAFKYPAKYQMSKAVSDDYMTFWQYKQELSKIDAKDENGETVNGLKKERVIDYINNLDMDYGQRIILYRSMYNSQADRDDYNSDILDYLNSRDDLSYEEKVTILKELDFTVTDDGDVYWD